MVNVKIHIWCLPYLAIFTR